MLMCICIRLQLCMHVCMSALALVCVDERVISSAFTYACTSARQSQHACMHFCKRRTSRGECFLSQVYKFSKFIHGSAVLLTELVAAAPYWIDDVSIRDSINSSAPTGPNQRRTPIGAPPGKDKKSKDDDTMTMTSFGESFSQLKTLPVPEGDPADSVTHPLIARTSASTRPHGQYTDFLRSTAAPGGGDEECSCCGLMAGAKKLPRKVPVRVEPKTYFANERTFLSWVNMSVTLGSISSALTVFGDSESAEGAGTQVRVNVCMCVCMCVWPVVRAQRVTTASGRSCRCCSRSSPRSLSRTPCTPSTCGGRRSGAVKMPASIRCR